MRPRELALPRRPSPVAGVLGLLVLWTALPAFLLIGRGGTFNGAYGIDVPDLMQYMGFIRDSGQHVLISNLFNVAPDPHLFLDPAFAISGLAWRLGTSIQFALLMWVPVVAAAIGAAFLAYTRDRVGAGQAAVAIALAIAFFYLSPAIAFSDWLGGSFNLRFGTRVVGLEMYTGAYAWGGGPALAIAAMPVFLLSAERLLDPSRRREGRGPVWYLGWAGLAGLLSTWLHPWQGITLLLIALGLAAWGRFGRRYLLLLLPAALTAAPLAYYFALSHTNSSWAMAAHTNDFAHFGWWLWLGLAPVLLALPGLATLRRDEIGERMLVIWPVAAAVVYLALDRTWFYHAFSGLSLPLAVLAVRGWRAWHVPRLAGLAAILLVTVPGAVWVIQQLVDTRRAQFFAPGEGRALAFLDHAARRGPVLAPTMPLGQAVPAFTGRQTYTGHYYWTPSYAERDALTSALFDGRLARVQAIQLIRASRAVFLVSDCRHARVDLRSLLGEEISQIRRFGCATVYELRSSRLVAQTSEASSPRRTRESS